MRCSVYTGRGELVLVPDCMQASREAERGYGPLRHCGTFETTGLPDDLAERIDDAFEDRLFVVLQPDLALRLGYDPGGGVPLPDGFEWVIGDFWEPRAGATLVYAGRDQLPVAEATPDDHDRGWYAVTRLYRPWPFRGTRVAATRGAALQFLALWVVANADVVRSEIANLRA
jgi:hypothetical protein